jgi:hypothetical protein
MSEEEENDDDDSEINLQDWKANTKKHIDMIESFEPHDRLDYSFMLFYMFIVLRTSCEGWLQWLQNPALTKEFKEEQLKEYYIEIKGYALDLLSLDSKATDKYEQVMKKVEKAFGKIDNGDKSKHQLRYT